jgi:AcrR family transcriptional regulator
MVAKSVKPGASGLVGVRRHVNRLPPERRVADILLAARSVFTEKGYHEALISEIADRAGVVEGSIYRFFANKRDLLVKTVEHWYEDMLAHDDEQFRGVRGTWNRIRFVVHHHLASIRRDPALSRLVFHELRPDPDYRKTRLFQLNQVYTHRIVEIVKAAAASGEFRSDVSPSLVRDMIYGAVEHRTWSFLRNEGDFRIEQTADSITEIIYRGLAQSGPATPGVERLEKAVERLEALAGEKRGGKRAARRIRAASTKSRAGAIADGFDEPDRPQG